MASHTLAPGASKDHQLQRIEAFSDGVFAIACTLLVLEITVPHLDEVTRPGALWAGLRATWPSFVAYVVSFTTILIGWAGHHRALNLLTRSSKCFLYSNGALLLVITFMPFPTAVLAAYINTPQANVAVMFYSATSLVLNVAFTLWWSSMFYPVRLVRASVPRRAVRKATVQMIFGSVIYVGTTALAYWFPKTSLALVFGVQLLWVAVSSEKDEL